MPRVQIPITTVTETGTVQPSAVVGDAANDHYIDGGTDILVECKNTSAGTLVATFVTNYQTPGGVALGNNDVSVLAGAIELVKLKGVGLYYQQTTDLNRIYVNVTSNSWEFRAYAIT